MIISRSSSFCAASTEEGRAWTGTGAVAKVTSALSRQGNVVPKEKQ